MFIEPTITWVPSGFSGYIWLDTKIVLKIFYSDSKIPFMLFFIEPTITWVPSGFSGYICLDTKIVLKKFSIRTRKYPLCCFSSILFIKYSYIATTSLMLLSFYYSKFIYYILKQFLCDNATEF